LGLEFHPGMLAFYQRYQNVERETPDGVHHRLLSRPVSQERVGTFRRAFSPALLSLVEEFLGSEMMSLGYSPEGSRGLVHSPEEERAKRHVLRYYDEIASGKLRRQQRVRMAGKMWLYRYFGPALSLFPSTRLAVSGDDWVKRAASLGSSSDARGAGGA
jgi:hypothetical protein